MSDMPNDFWAGWIAVLTIVSLLGLAWLVISVYFSDPGPLDAESQVWDETLKEGSNPAPMWWFWMILLLMVFSVVYLMLYPGLGSFKGALRWSQGGHLEHSSNDYELQFGALRKEIAQRPIGELQQDEAVMQSAQRIYDRNCAVCHGYDAAGQASMFPNLVDDDWQWGGSAAQIEQTIRAGRNAVMVSWSAVLGEQGVAEVTDYVANMRNASEHPGKLRYQQFCIACHGPDGLGNVVLGAPNLADDTWLYGGTADDIRHSIAIGRNGVMPAFDSRLDDAQVRMLVALLLR